MAEPTYTYLLLKRLHWLQAHTFPVGWNRREGDEGSIEVDDQDEANALYHDLIEYEISSSARPLHADSDTEPVHAKAKVGMLESKPVRKLLHMRRDYADAVHDQRVKGESHDQTGEAVSFDQSTSTDNYDQRVPDAEHSISIYRPLLAA